MISSFQCEVNAGIRIAPNVGAILMGQNDVLIADFWWIGYELGKHFQRHFQVVELLA